MQGEWAEHRPTPAQPLRLVDRSPTQPHFGLRMGRHREIPAIANSWSRDHNCLLTVAPELLVVSIVRFAYCNQHTRKLRRSIRLKKTISVCTIGEADLPALYAVQRDIQPELENLFQFPTHATMYELLGGIIHIGDQAHTGHYRAFTVILESGGHPELSQQEVMMHDDNALPKRATKANLAQIASNVYVLAFRQGGSS